MTGSTCVSVVVPVLDTVRYLPSCLDSILGQSLERIEVLCVDDGSTDGSRELLERYAELDDRVVVWRHDPPRSGPGVLRNAAIRRAEGDYVAFVDSDDHIHPQMLERLYRAAKLDEDTDVVICRMLKFSDAGAHERFGRDTYDRRIPRDLDGRPFTWRDIDDVFGLRFASCNKLYRRDFLAEHDIRYSEGIFFEDMIFTYRALLEASSLRFVREDLYFNRKQREGSTTFTQGGRVIGSLEAMDQVEAFLASRDDLRSLLPRFVAFKFTKLAEYLPKNDSEHLPAFFAAFRSFATDPRLDDNPHLTAADREKRAVLLESDLTRFLSWEIWNLTVERASLRRERSALRARCRELESRWVVRLERKARHILRRLVDAVRSAPGRDPDRRAGR